MATRQIVGWAVADHLEASSSCRRSGPPRPQTPYRPAASRSGCRACWADRLGPSGPAPASRPARVDGTLVKALARAHRWQGMLNSGGFGSIEELAAAERINPSYIARVLRLTLLAPAIVDSILDGRHDPERITLDRLIRPFPVTWREQLQNF